MQSPNKQRFKCGATSDNHPGLVFLQYNKGRERWVTPERLCEFRKRHAALTKRWINSSERGRQYSDKLIKRTSDCTKQFRRGDQNPAHPDLVFLYYARGKEKWGTKQELARYRVLHGEKRFCRGDTSPKHPGKIFSRYHGRKEIWLTSAQFKKAKQRERAFDAKWSKSEKAVAGRRKRAPAYLRHKRATDAGFRMSCSLRQRISAALKNQNIVKSDSTIKLVGCSIPALKIYIESQFTEGMSWERLRSGEIQIDHKLPLSMFDLRDPKQQRIAFHFENLQPLWGGDNRQKSDKIEGELFRGRDLRKIIQFPSKQSAA